MCFYETKFTSQVYFFIKKATEEISLLSTKFDDNVYFSEEFLSQANLSEAIIDISKIILPNKIDSSKILKDPDNYRIFRRYYANKLDHELERKYFALELESKPFPRIEKLEKWTDIRKYLLRYPYDLMRYFGDRSITFLYKLTSNYGDSIFRPAICVLTIYLITIFSSIDCAFNVQCFGEILGQYSRIILTHIPFGYGADDDKIYQYSNDWARFFNGSIMYVGLFLMGLAMRNRFKIK